MFVEPSSAVTLAGILSKKAFLGKRNVCLLSGGNANLEVLSEILKKSNI